MEVDTQSGPVASLLTTLARFGQQAVPGPSEVTDLLFDLGESLFTGSSGGDDRLFEYRFVLSAAAEDPEAVQATFAPGRYVLRRGQNRAAPQDWKNVNLDLNTGRLVDAENKEVRNEFYMVLNVRKYPDGTPPESYEFDSWSSFRSALQQEVDDRTKPIEKVTAAVNGQIRERRSDEWRAQLVRRWAAAEGRLHALRTRHIRYAQGFDPASCPIARERPDRRSQEAELNARDALRAFVAEYQLATKPAGENEEFKSEDREAVASRVARFFMPWSGDTEAHFADAAAFDSFVKDASTGLVPQALATAKGAPGPEAQSCTDLEAAA